MHIRQTCRRNPMRSKSEFRVLPIKWLNVLIVLFFSVSVSGCAMNPFTEIKYYFLRKQWAAAAIESEKKLNISVLKVKCGSTDHEYDVMMVYGFAWIAGYVSAERNTNFSLRNLASYQLFRECRDKNKKYVHYYYDLLRRFNGAIEDPVIKKEKDRPYIDQPYYLWTCDGLREFLGGPYFVKLMMLDGYVSYEKKRVRTLKQLKELVEVSDKYCPTYDSNLHDAVREYYTYFEDDWSALSR